jgi:hypothetical protein
MPGLLRYANGHELLVIFLKECGCAWRDLARKLLQGGMLPSIQAVHFPVGVNWLKLRKTLIS